MPIPNVPAIVTFAPIHLAAIEVDTWPPKIKARPAVIRRRFVERFGCSGLSRWRGPRRGADLVRQLRIRRLLVCTPRRYRRAGRCLAHKEERMNDDIRLLSAGRQLAVVPTKRHNLDPVPDPDPDVTCRTMRVLCPAGLLSTAATRRVSPSPTFLAIVP